MITEETEKSIEETNYKVIEFIVELLKNYSPIVVAGVLTSTGLGVYRSCLTEKEYNDMVDAISSSRSDIYRLFPEPQTRMLH
jgi:hypothetical protein